MRLRSTLALAAVFVACDGGGSATPVATNAVAPRFLVTVHPQSQSTAVRTHRIDVDSGAQELAGEAVVPALVDAVAVHPSGRFLYAARHPFGGAGIANAAVQTIALDQTTGALAFLGTTSLPTTGDLEGLVVRADGRFAYAVFQDFPAPDHLQAFAVDAASGELSALGAADSVGLATSIAITPDGRFLYVGRSAEVIAYSLDAATGGFARIQELASGTPAVVQVAPGGTHVYVAGASSDPTATDTLAAYRVGDDGRLELVGAPVATGLGPGPPHGTQGTLSMVVDPRGRYVFVGGAGPGSFHRVAVFRVDASTGGISLFETVSAASTGGMVADADGRVLYVGGSRDGFARHYPVPEAPDGVDRNTHVQRFRIDAVDGLEVQGLVRPHEGLHGLALVHGAKPARRIARWACVVCEQDGRLVVLRVDDDSGVLTPVATVAVGAGAAAVAATVRGGIVHVANRVTGDVTTVRVDLASGQPQLVGSPVAAGAGASGMVIDPLDRYLHVIARDAGTLSTFAIGAGGALGAPFVQPVAMPVAIAITPTGRNLYVMRGAGDVAAYVIGATGQPSFEIATATGTMPSALGAAPDGTHVYALDAAASDVTTFRVVAQQIVMMPNLIDYFGRLWPVGATLPAGVGPAAIAIEPAGRFVHVVNHGSDDVTTYARAFESGALTEVGTEVAVGDGPAAIQVDPSGRFAYVANRGAGTVSVLRLAAGTPEVVATVQVGGAPTAIALLGVIE